MYSKTATTKIRLLLYIAVLFALQAQGKKKELIMTSEQDKALLAVVQQTTKAQPSQHGTHVLIKSLCLITLKDVCLSLNSAVFQSHC